MVRGDDPVYASFPFDCVAFDRVAGEAHRGGGKPVLRYDSAEPLPAPPEGDAEAAAFLRSRAPLLAVVGKSIEGTWKPSGMFDKDAGFKGLEEVRESHFATYGVSDWPTANPENPDWVPTVLPDLQGFIERQLSIAQLGSAGGGVNVTDQGRIETRGLRAYGIYAETKGSTGASGRNGSMFRSAHAGRRGKDGGPVSVTANGEISPSSISSNTGRSGPQKRQSARRW